MKKGEVHGVHAHYEKTKMGKKQVFMCTHQNCTCWFRRKGDLIKHQKSEHEK